MSENYFVLFGLKPIFNIDLQALEANFRKIQSEVHPDRFVTGTTTEKLHSMQTATLANEAYSTLKNPALRATYLLSLQGIQANSETNTSMPADFLMQTMEWREALDDAKQAKDIHALGLLHKEMQTEAKTLQAELIELFDNKNAPLAARETTRKLIFIDKVCADIDTAIEQLD
ncbi:MAG: Fe-S protein assembly co-chaperone HscB [Methylophilaceae bacterium]